MCKIISNRLRESAPAGRQTLRREIRIPIVYNFLQLSRKKFVRSESFGFLKGTQGFMSMKSQMSSVSCDNTPSSPLAP